jgi:hypothetical protein
MPTLPAPGPDDTARLRKANLRTAAILLSIALVFFGGVIVAQYLGGTTAGIAVVGIAVLLYLVAAIGGNLRSGK